MKRPNFPLVSNLLDRLGALPARSFVVGLPARDLHHELTTVLAVAENAIQIVELSPPPPMPATLPKPIPQQVREVLDKVCEESPNHLSAIALHTLYQRITDEDAIKLRNLLR
jgi:hypothetical protein